ncbi:1603_t:CDS:2 [Entrophospora sp. SA101]|nr:1603_t:CDS:2 [Entrophospora sp. SA101]CAJ0824983.1 21034_t:CDS:2 [Entrophospora sp. SA101]
MVAGELVMEDEDIIALIQPTEIDEQQDETFIPEISITDTIMKFIKFLCTRTLRKKLLSHDL